MARADAFIGRGACAGCANQDGHSTSSQTRLPYHGSGVFGIILHPQLETALAIFVCIFSKYTARHVWTRQQVRHTNSSHSIAPALSSPIVALAAVRGELSNSGRISLVCSAFHPRLPCGALKLVIPIGIANRRLSANTNDHPRCRPLVALHVLRLQRTSPSKTTDLTQITALLAPALVAVLLDASRSKYAQASCARQHLARMRRPIPQVTAMQPRSRL